MFQEVYNNSIPWLTSNAIGIAGSLASLFALTCSLYTIFWVRKARLLIRQDRERRSFELPEVYYNLKEVRKYLIGIRNPATESDIEMFRKIDRAESAVERCLENIFEKNMTSSNPFVAVASYYAELGQVSRAIIYYEKAVPCFEAAQNDDADDLRVCLCELRKCHLALWQIERAMRLQHRILKISTEQPDCDLSLRGKNGMATVAHCFAFMLRFAARDAKATVTGKKGQLRITD